MRAPYRQALAQAQPMKNSRGVRLGGEQLNFVPAECVIRPLRHNVLIAPLDVVYSRYLLVKRDTKPLRGRILAVGPGHYPRRYLDAQRLPIADWKRSERRYVTQSRVFVPTEVKPGMVVELGGAEIEGYAFEQFWWGEQIVLWCTENDICGVVDEQPDATEIDGSDSQGFGSFDANPIANPIPNPQRARELAAR